MNIEDKTSKSEAPSEMCKTCKRFWANVNFGGLCSKCYKYPTSYAATPARTPRPPSRSQSSRTRKRKTKNPKGK